MIGRAFIPMLLLLLGFAAPAQGAVTLTFYSKELGATFPHAFILLTGAPDADPEHPVDANYGFTAKAVTPALLMGPVNGEIMAVPAGYLRHSQPHLALRLTDDQYRAVMATVDRWRNLPGKSYDLNHRNCVFFVGDVARTLGMTVEDPPALMKKPRSYIENLARLNPGIGTRPADPADQTRTAALGDAVSVTRQAGEAGRP